ncbi:MAG: class I SAM-dependent methyltransferase [Candidatus Cyclobacteriaceae bacterium M3_2C_046]
MNRLIYKTYFLYAIWMLVGACKSADRPYNYKHFPKKYQEIKHDYHRYYEVMGCQSGEVVGSIGAGNGLKEVQISCVVDSITWYLQEIDSIRLYQFHQVLAHHEQLRGDPVQARFRLVLGDQTSTGLPSGIFDRLLMINVFHELEARENIMQEMHQLMTENGVLVILERMGHKPGDIHADCKFPKLFEPDFLKEMDQYDYQVLENNLISPLSNLSIYKFKSSR